MNMPSKTCQSFTSDTVEKTDPVNVGLQGPPDADGNRHIPNS